MQLFFLSSSYLPRIADCSCAKGKVSAFIVGSIADVFGSRKKSPEEKISRRINPPPQKPVRRIKSPQKFPADKIPLLIFCNRLNKFKHKKL